MLKQLHAKVPKTLIRHPGRFRPVVILLFVLTVGVAGAWLLRSSKAAVLDLNLRTVATGYSGVTDIASTTIAGDTRLFIVERTGVIRILYPDGTKVATPFLTVPSGKVTTGGERGMLGLVFHPNYSSNRYFYVTYTDTANALKVARYTRDATNANTADPNSEVIILTVPHPDYQNHNGGDLNFGPDGYLYISTGDGGGAGNPTNSAQNKDSLQGKLLRINVNSGSPYSIPADNPFAGAIAGADEVWAYGLRNPWRFSFDRQTNDMWIADVGQVNREEINFQPAGQGGRNYGWRCYEGTRSYNTTGCGAFSAYVGPVGEYDHANNRCAVTGGYRYRGSQFPAMSGYYFFGDYCSGQFYSLKSDGSGGWTQELQNETTVNVSTFGESVTGELYLADLGGEVYQLQTQTTAPGDTTAPSVSVTAPGNGATVSGTSTITATASDDVGVVRVEILVDNVVKSTDTSSPYSYAWDTTSVTNGTHAVAARAYDAADNVTSSTTVNVTVNNAVSNPLPTPWSSSDVGTVGLAGSAAYTNNVYTLNGAGSDIGGTADSFQFVQQPLNGDGQLTARITSLENTHAEAKAGVMIRDTLAGNAISFSLLIKPTAAGGMVFETRTGTGATTTVSPVVTNTAAPVWLRLQRQNDNLSTYWSTDGANWQHIVNSTLNFGVNTYVGMVVSSHSTATLATATFDNVTLLSGGASPPIIDISNPGHSGVFGGLVDVTTEIVDSDGVAKVEFIVDGVLLATDTTVPFTYAWNTTTLINGEHMLSTKAYDSSGNNSIHTHIVDIQNGSALERSDINNDNVVNIFDLSILLANYGRAVGATSNPRSDVNASGTVDIFDLSMLLNNYGQ
jgi:glucose/arabinose dehydrogenase/regulation of enolase protein 1 (concanavalin A-like superfamily)